MTFLTNGALIKLSMEKMIFLVIEEASMQYPLGLLWLVTTFFIPFFKSITSSLTLELNAPNADSVVFNVALAAEKAPEVTISIALVAAINVTMNATKNV